MHTGFGGSFRGMVCALDGRMLTSKRVGWGYDECSVIW